MKIILVLIFFTVVLIFSYSKLDKEEINYTILGDKDLFSNNITSKNFSDLIYDELNKEKNFGFYSKDFIEKDIRIIDLINNIDDNKKVDNISILNILKRSNILLLNIGSNEIYYKLSKINMDENTDRIIYDYLDEVYNDYLILINKIKLFSDGKIIILGFYNNTNNPKNNKYYEYINNKIYNYSNSNDLVFMDLYVILNKNEDYLTNTTPVYISNNGNLALFNKIYSKINKLYLHKNY